jgi:uncharacterized membrane protein
MRVPNGGAGPAAQRRASLLRSLAKSLSWRVLASATTFNLSYLVTGEIAVATSIAALDVGAKLILYFGHERAWNMAPWGRA